MDDLVLKITVVILQLVNIKRKKLVLFGSRNPIYLKMSFCGVLFVYFGSAFCWWILQLHSEPVLGSSLFTALHLSLLQQPVLCRAVCTYSEISAHTGACLPADAVGVQRQILFHTGACGWPRFALLCVSSRGQCQAY